MTTEFVRCDFCKSEIAAEGCKLAAYNTVIDGKRYTFCCEQCARRHKERMEKQKK